MMNLALRQWRDSFAQEPVDALDRLIRGLVPLGTASQLSLGEFFSIAFERGDSAFDAAVRAWLDAHILQPIPARMIPGRWSVLLAEFFRGIADWQFTETGDLLRKKHQDIRMWLRGLYEGSDRDPESSYLLALAYHQADQRFSSLWRRIILAEEMPERPWRSIGIFGFRKMPDAQGNPAADVPDGLLHALVQWADKSGTKKNEWLQTVRSLFAAYPSSEAYWVGKFAQIMESSSVKIVHAHKWLSDVLPQWTTGHEVMGNHNSVGATGRSMLPSREERENWIQRIEEQPKESQTTEFSQYLSRYRGYTRATGDTHFLVRTFNNVAVKVASKDHKRSQWALGLMEEALDWEPYNPHNWTSYARVLSAAKRKDDALQALWHARYRFLWNAVIRNELGRLLRETGDLATSESVLREAAAHFPNNVVFLSSLAETLRAMDKVAEARKVLEAARKLSPQNVFCLNSLADLLIETNELEEAEALYQEELKIDPTNEYAQTGIAKVWFVKSVQTNDEKLREKARDLLTKLAANGGYTAQIRLPHFDQWWAEGVAQGASYRGADAKTSAPQPIKSKQRRIDDMSPVERLGRSMVAIWQAERATNIAERARICDQALQLLEVPENKMGELLTGFVEARGLVLLARGEAQAALDYFTEQIERLGRGGWIGIRLGAMRARIMLGEAVDIESDTALFDSSHARFIFHVAEVICRLDHNDSNQQELAQLLRNLYPRAATMAAPETLIEKWDDEEEPQTEGPTVLNSRDMVAQFVLTRWFQPAGIHAEADLGSPDAIRRVSLEIEKSRQDTLDLISATAPALAAA